MLSFALPFVNQHKEQLKAVTVFLKDGQVTVDIFAVSHRGKTTPIEEAILEAGEEVRIDVVVRTRKVGHRFPAGTIDAFDIWLELKAVDENGAVVFWNGYVDGKDGNGPVDPSAHFYKSHMIDAHGNPINKRNAWATRTVLYNRTIPPGAADTVRFKLKVPVGSTGKINFQAKLNRL